MTEFIDNLKKEFPEFEGIPTDALVDYVHQKHYPDTDRNAVSRAMGYEPTKVGRAVKGFTSTIESVIPNILKSSEVLNRGLGKLNAVLLNEEYQEPEWVEYKQKLELSNAELATTSAQVGSAFGSAGKYAGLSLLGLGLPAMATEIFGGVYSETEETHPEWSEGKRVFHALARSIPEALLERWGTSQLLDPMLGVGKITLKQALTRTGMFYAVKQGAKNFLTEGVQEVSQTITGNGMDKLFRIDRGLFDNVIESFFMGGLVGSTFGVGSGLYQQQYIKKFQDRLKNAGLTDAEIQEIGDIMVKVVDKEIMENPENFKEALGILTRADALNVSDETKKFADNLLTKVNTKEAQDIINNLSEADIEAINEKVEVKETEETLEQYETERLNVIQEAVDAGVDMTVAEGVINSFDKAIGELAKAEGKTKAQALKDRKLSVNQAMRDIELKGYMVGSMQNDIDSWVSPETIVTETGEGGREAFTRTKRLVADWIEGLNATKKEITNVMNKVSAGKKLTETQQIIYDEMVESWGGIERAKAELQQPLYQSDRGAYIKTKSGENIVTMLENADKSTFLHEMSHFFLQWYIDVAPESLEPMMKWAGVKDISKPAQYKKFHEKFADGAEAYFQEGKAPSKELETIFEKFKNFLAEIYDKAKVVLNDDVRAFYDKVFTGTVLDKKKGFTAEMYKSEYAEDLPQLIKEYDLPKDSLLSDYDNMVEKVSTGEYEAREIMFDQMNDEVDILDTITNRVDLDKLKDADKIGEYIIYRKSQEATDDLTDIELFQKDLKDVIEGNKEKEVLDEYKLSLEAKQSAVFEVVKEMDLENYNNLREAMSLPAISKMNEEQINQYVSEISKYEVGDKFFTKRTLETAQKIVDMKDIKTYRQAQELLAKKLGVPVSKVLEYGSEVKASDMFRYETALAEKNPFFKYLVERTQTHLLDAEGEYLTVEDKVQELAKKANKSRKKSVVEKLIPSNERIINYLEASPANKLLIQDELTKEELDYAIFIEEEYSKAYDYLIKIKALEGSRFEDNYFTHMRKGFLETWKDSGVVKAIQNIFQQQKDDQAVFNILDQDTGNILPKEKFFANVLFRSGEMDYSKNVTRVFLQYMKSFTKKVAFDQMIPELDIYVQSLTPQHLTPKGLEMDRSLKKFVYKYVNNKKGRKESFGGTVPQGGKIDVSLRMGNTLVSLLDLGLYLPGGIAAFVGEQMMTYQSLGAVDYAKGLKKTVWDAGIARSQHKNVDKIMEQAKPFIGKNIFDELMEVDKPFGEKALQAIFGLYAESSRTANKIFLLASLTKEELESGNISNERLAEMKIDAGRWRDMGSNVKSIAGSTSTGATINKYKTWAIPIMRTTIKDIEVLTKNIASKNLTPKELVQTREFRELMRATATTAVVLMMGGYVLSDDDDETFLGQIKKRAYREASTFLQGISPKMFLSTGRLVTFAYQLADNLQKIVLLESYSQSGKWGNKGDLKGVKGLERMLTPRVIKQFTK